ncbi:MAG: aminotransferase class III-fold pyridoxal phosphate-dependent enzyme [Chlorobi bacterium]|nr:aminotransferase class III-fold pyridoxal phosphate-dependent enzyme [Chlorobiota bacterium]
MEEINNSWILTDSINNALPLAEKRIGSCIVASGKKYYEISGGSHASFIVNHNNKIIEKLKSYLDISVLPLNGRKYNSRWQSFLSKFIVDKLNDLEAKVYFTSGGTEGIETAIRLTLSIHRNKGFKTKEIFITRMNSYHGMSVYTRLIANHYKHSNEDLASLKKPTELLLEDPLCSKCPYNLKFPECQLKCATRLNEIIEIIGQNNIAGIIIEPIGGTTSGAVVPPSGYIETLSTICKENNIIFIADEVISSFYRSGKFFWTENIDVGIRVGGKCLSGGYGPICSVVISGNLINEISGKMTLPLRLTYAGNPITCMTALSVQEVIIEENILSNLKEKELAIYSHLKEFTNTNENLSFRGVGLIWAISLNTNSNNPQELSDLYAKYFDEMGLEIMIGIYPNDNSMHFLFSPALDIGFIELQRNLNLFTNSIKDVTYEKGI